MVHLSLASVGAFRPIAGFCESLGTTGATVGLEAIYTATISRKLNRSMQLMLFANATIIDHLFFINNTRFMPILSTDYSKDIP